MICAGVNTTARLTQQLYVHDHTYISILSMCLYRRSLTRAGPQKKKKKFDEKIFRKSPNELRPTKSKSVMFVGWFSSVDTLRIRPLLYNFYSSQRLHDAFSSQRLYDAFSSLTMLLKVDEMVFCKSSGELPPTKSNIVTFAGWFSSIDHTSNALENRSPQQKDVCVRVRHCCTTSNVCTAIYRRSH